MSGSKLIPLLLGFAGLLGLSGCVVEHSIGKAGDDTGSESAADTSTDAGGETSDTGGHVCMPGPDASACQICEAQQCCPEHDACAEDLACVCLVPCLLDGHSQAACENDCGVDDGRHTEVIHCLSELCPTECGL